MKMGKLWGWSQKQASKVMPRKTWKKTNKAARSRFPPLISKKLSDRSKKRISILGSFSICFYRAATQSLAEWWCQTFYRASHWWMKITWPKISVGWRDYSYIKQLTPKTRGWPLLNRWGGSMQGTRPRTTFRFSLELWPNTAYQLRPQFRAF